MRESTVPDEKTSELPVTLVVDEDRHPPAFLMNNPLRGIVERRGRFDHLLHEGDVVADLGCGSGYYTLHFSSVVGPEGLVYGTDTNAPAIGAIKKRIARKDIGNIRVSTSSSAALGFIPDASVDFVLSNLTLCCMIEHGRAVDEMLRIMKQGAVAYVSITTVGRKADRRNMSREEFEAVKARFSVIEIRDGLTVSSALLKKV